MICTVRIRLKSQTDTPTEPVGPQNPAATQLRGPISPPPIHPVPVSVSAGRGYAFSKLLR
jgi:hypothetical protein